MTQLTFGFLCWPLGQHDSTNLLVLVVPFAHSFIQALSHSLFHCRHLSCASVLGSEETEIKVFPIKELVVQWGDIHVSNRWISIVMVGSVNTWRGC